MDHIPRIDMHVHLKLKGLLEDEACYKIIIIFLIIKTKKKKKKNSVIIFINQNLLWLQKQYSTPY